MLLVILMLLAVFLSCFYTYDIFLLVSGTVARIGRIGLWQTAC